ncbi:MAG: Hydrolase, TatD family [candidate division WWE3 bacterium GW2011_GWC1_41_7]|uniref:Hydrolase, TatD family n=2 Tax=Katanobacteria TaxID=422282 RepID=A0A0G1A698_UNCKA|nr:MAG: Hydrolase, TatD family [candidate division WWE3 bacterium GW2011_GWB1_41_6]KKS20853.1 MAG: Hydrolase, TatD family [candidate division WWE3 bacterium GW2011_GWC1_41_7]
MLIDSHLHFPHDENKVREQISGAEKEGIVKFINIGTSLKDSAKSIETAEKFENVYATVAVYPHDDKDKDTYTIMEHLKELALSSKKVVAIGECGIDLSEWKNGRSLDQQTELFEAQINLAIELRLPLIIHNRNGDETVLELLQKYKNTGLAGVAHCFVSSWDTAQKLLDLNFYISFSGIITYPSGKYLSETVQKVPNDRFLVETDAPYLPPQGHRGEKNEPKYVKITALKVAEIKDLPLQSIEDYTYENTTRLFHL